MRTAACIMAAVCAGPSLGGRERAPLATPVLSQHSIRLGGHPRPVGRFARSQAPAAAGRVKVERPQRSEDERP
jgi:hypothetical protein